MNTRVETKHLFNENISPNIKKLVMMKRSGLPLTEGQKLELELFNEMVSVVQPTPKHTRDRIRTDILKQVYIYIHTNYN